MFDLKLNSQHDLLLKENRLVLTDGMNAIAQRIKIVLLTFAGEWFLDISQGLPYFDEILVKNPNSTRIYAIFRRQIARVRGVKRVINLTLSVDRKSRSLIVEFEAESVEGVIKDKISIKRYEQ